MPTRTTIIWVHGMGDTQLGFASQLSQTLCSPFAASQPVSSIVHEEIVYEDLNDLAAAKIKHCDLALSDICGAVSLPLVGSLETYRGAVKDALGDVFPDWLSRGIRLWIFQRFNQRVLAILKKALDDGVSPAEHSINIVCHSLGTFMVYEYLHWAKDVFGVGVESFRLDNVFMLASPIALMKELGLGALMNNYDLALNSELAKPWVHNPATGAPISNIRKLWTYRHKLDPVASITPLRGELLDHPAWTFDQFHSGPNMHAYTNYLTEFNRNMLARVLGLGLP